MERVELRLFGTDFTGLCGFLGIEGTEKTTTEFATDGYRCTQMLSPECSLYILIETVLGLCRLSPAIRCR